MSLLGWVLVGLAVWLMVAVVIALLLARLLRANSHTTLDVLRAQHRLEADPLRVPEVDGWTEKQVDRDLPFPREGVHDEAESAAERRRPRG